MTDDTRRVLRDMVDMLYIHHPQHSLIDQIEDLLNRDLKDINCQSIIYAGVTELIRNKKEKQDES